MRIISILFLLLSFIIFPATSNTEDSSGFLQKNQQDSVHSQQYSTQLNDLQNIYETERLNAAKERKHLYTLLILSSSIFLIVLLILNAIYTKRLRQKNRIIVERIQEQIQRERELRRIKQAGINIRSGKHPSFPEPNSELCADFSREERLVNQLRFWLTENNRFTQSDLNRKFIADSLGTNEKYLADAIRNQCEGQTVSDFINSLRLAYACDLLANDFEMTIEAVSSEVGINSRTTLFRLFRKHYGISPSEYRDTQKNKIKDY